MYVKTMKRDLHLKSMFACLENFMFLLNLVLGIQKPPVALEEKYTTG